MSYQPIPFPSFGGGLNLRDKTDAVNEYEAIDLLNVSFTDRGAVEQRAGYATFTGSALTSAVDSLSPFYTASGTKQLLAGCGTRLEALNTSGSVVASATGLSGGPWSFARFGTPGNEYAYAGNGTDTVQRWSGAAWSAPAGMPKAGSLCVMSPSNRLVATRYATTTGGPGATTSSPSYVYFSDAGAPETWTSTNSIQLTPGDGEQIQACIAWREFVFVFKETRFFVFYGESQDATGQPVFDYHTVDAGAGCASPRAVCADETGVYFMDRRGVYRTTGGEPELLSALVDPIFLGGASSFYQGGVLAHSNITNCAMGTHEHKVYLAFPTSSTNNRMLVTDPRYGWWSLYDVAASALASFRISDQAELVFGYPAASNDVGRHSSTWTADGGNGGSTGTAITSYWRSGWFDYGDPSIKTIRESKIWGTGVASLGVSADFASGTGTLDSLDFSDPTASTWGGSTWGGTTWATPAGLIPVLRRRATRGTVFSTYFYNNSLQQPWSVHRLQHHLRGKATPPSKKKIPVGT